MPLRSYKFNRLLGEIKAILDLLSMLRIVILNAYHHS